MSCLPGLGDLTSPPWLSVLNLRDVFEDQWSQLIFIPFPTFSLFSKPRIHWSSSLKEHCARGPMNLSFLLTWASFRGMFPFQPAEDAVLHVFLGPPGGAGDSGVVPPAAAHFSCWVPLLSQGTSHGRRVGPSGAWGHWRTSVCYQHGMKPIFCH